jgi:hypothetical protein
MPVERRRGGGRRARRGARRGRRARSRRGSPSPRAPARRIHERRRGACRHRPRSCRIRHVDLGRSGGRCFGGCRRSAVARRGGDSTAPRLAISEARDRHRSHGEGDPHDAYEPDEAPPVALPRRHRAPRSCRRDRRRCCSSCGSSWSRDVCCRFPARCSGSRRAARDRHHVILVFDSDIRIPSSAHSRVRGNPVLLTRKAGPPLSGTSGS